MKIRNGFVSNSSSTCFMFIFKDDNFDEMDKSVNNMIKYTFGKIPLSNDIYTSIMRHLTDNRIQLFNRTGLYTEIEERNEAFNDLKQDIITNEFDDILKLFFPQELKVLSKLFKSYYLGFNYLYTILYGDNEGDEWRTAVANHMDGNFIHYEGNNLFVITESNR